MSFDHLGLSEELLRAVKKQGYQIPTPIQKKAIPLILNKQDILGSAQTGTGKTAGFTLPLLQLLMKNKQQGRGKKQIRALIVTPTRELAAQVCQSVETYSAHLPLRTFVVFGGVSIEAQVRRLKSGVDILVATPGRLLDLVNRRSADLRNVDILVLDEADRMLDMGFMPDIKKIISLLPQKRQNLLFSATFSNEIKKLASGLLNKPKVIEVARQNAAADLVNQVVHHVDKKRKKDLLSHLLSQKDWERVLVFTRTKVEASRVASRLNKDGILSTEIHGDKTQAARTKALDNFKNGSVRVLVATDIAARGLDIEQLPHVINYSIPNIPQDYVHRIGRTGRAGHKGEALSLVCKDEVGFLRNIEQMLNIEIPQVTTKGFTTTAVAKKAKFYSGQEGKPWGRYRRGKKRPNQNKSRRSAC